MLLQDLQEMVKETDFVKIDFIKQIFFKGYYGLEGLSNSTFKVLPLVEIIPVTAGQTSTISSQSSAKDVELNYKPIGEETYVRSGLLGFLGPGGLVFVCGSKDGLMTVTGRKHNADDIIATVLAVEPMR